MGVNSIEIGVVFIIRRNDGKYLFGKRTSNCRDEVGNWQFGGGGIEIGETLETALKREISEEYGVELENYKLLGHREIIKNKESVSHWIIFDFLCEIKGNPTNMEPDKMEKIERFSLDSLPLPIHSAIPGIIEMYNLS